MIEAWRKVSTKPLGNFRVFSVRSDTKVSPRTGREHEFFIIDSVNWVNVIALTSDGQIVMIEQFRQGSDTVELEIPGGMMDATDPSPVAAGCRELREETGYEGDNAQIIGRVFPNPAIMSNICYTVLVENCRCAAPTHFDVTEEVVTKLYPVAEVPGLVASGKIQHSLVVAALYHFALWRKA